jgi:hypothetical protein
MSVDLTAVNQARKPSPFAGMIGVMALSDLMWSHDQMGRLSDGRWRGQTTVCAGITQSVVLREPFVPFEPGPARDAVPVQNHIEQVYYYARSLPKFF